MKRLFIGLLLMAAFFTAGQTAGAFQARTAARTSEAVLPEKLLLGAALRAGWQPEEMRISFWGEGDNINAGDWLAGLTDALSDVLTEAWAAEGKAGSTDIRYMSQNIQGAAAVYFVLGKDAAAGSFQITLLGQDHLLLLEALRSYLAGTFDRFEIALALSGYVPGELKYRRAWAEALLDGMGVRILMSIQEQAFAYYAGYSDALYPFYGKGYPTNGEAAFRYDEEAGRTRVWLGVPMIPGSY